LEIRGEVRRGYFVRGLPGLQFALPEVVERLRAARDDSQAQATEADLVVLNACDPANLYGPTRDDAPRLATAEPLSFARLPSTWLVQQAGLPLLIAENSAAALATLEGVGENLARPALAALLAHLSHFEHRLKVETWNTQPILDSPARPLLESLGFYRDYPGMTWERR
jgi:ATP-dependent Lhr-like helicase